METENVTSPDVGPKVVKLAREGQGAPQQGQDTPQNDPQARLYDFSVGKYDVVVKTGPSFATQREEAAAQMIELVRAQPELAMIAGDLIAENLDFPNAQELAKRLKKMLPPQLQEGADGQPGQPPIPPEMQQQLEQAQQAIQEHQQLKLKSEADKVSMERQQLEMIRRAIPAEKQMAMKEIDIARRDAILAIREAQAPQPAPMPDTPII